MPDLISDFAIDISIVDSLLFQDSNENMLNSTAVAAASAKKPHSPTTEPKGLYIFSIESKVFSN